MPDHRLDRRERTDRAAAALPHLGAPWANPVLQYVITRKTLSAIPGLTGWNFYFRLYPGSIRAPRVVEFVRHLSHPVQGRVLATGAGLPVHCSRRVQNFVAEQRGELRVERLSADAPELNPVEYRGDTGNNMHCSNSVPKSSGNSATTPAEACTASGDAPCPSRLSGNKRSSLRTLTMS